MSKRRVTPDELALWQKVTNTTERLSPDRDPGQKILRKTTSKRQDKEPTSLPADFSLGQRVRNSSRSDTNLPGTAAHQAQSPIQMDKKKHGQLKRGKVQPEARIDLHGMTLAQAQPALTTFVLSAHSQQKRLVLVITGKGKCMDDGGPIPARQGVLRHAVPQWLHSAPLSSLVLQVTQAHPKHGGGGAYYVYLRRSR